MHVKMDRLKNVFLEVLLQRFVTVLMMIVMDRLMMGLEPLPAVLANVKKK
jgi:hypothetical protein